MLLEELKILPDFGCTFCKSIDITESLHKAGWIERDKIEIDKGKLQALITEWYADYTDGRENLEARIINNIQSLIKEQA